MFRLFALFLSVLFFSSCSVTKYSPYKKFGADELKADYSVFRNTLEESHPGLYWYTPKDSINYYFDLGAGMLRDSMTEPQFRNVLSYVLEKIKCGHTTARTSKNYGRYRDSLRNLQFPLYIKFWPDTAVITFSLNREDSNLKRGTVLLAVDDVPMNTIVDTLFQFLSTDGYVRTHKYQTLSNRSVFSNLYLSTFGYRPKYSITYLDSLGKIHKDSINIFTPPKDTSRRGFRADRKISRAERKRRILRATRSLSIDHDLNTGFMDLNSFTQQSKLRRFFRRSFRELEKNGIENLVIDLRSNGGGSITNSNLLTKYLVDRPFRIADSLFAVNRVSKYQRYRTNNLTNLLFLLTMTKKRSDGNYHFRYYTNTYFRPKRNNHFDGHVYILTGGNTFSASTLVTLALRPQNNVTVVGEESGGSAYGNNAWLLPEVTLPKTKLRYRLPLFRLVIDKQQPKGTGVQPEVFVGPTVDAIRRNVDYKREKVVEMIREKR